MVRLDLARPTLSSDQKPLLKPYIIKNLLMNYTMGVGLFRDV